MPKPRPAISSEQLLYCQKLGMSASQAGTYLGRHHTTILYACRKFGIELPKYKSRYHAPISVIRRNEAIVMASDRKKPTWSCSPAAIERALRQLGKPPLRSPT